MLGALIGAGTSLLGGFMQKNAQKKEYKRQKEFAQHGIRWKAADAEAAGISKLYAMGANTTSYAPQSVGDYGVSSAGQQIGRAADAALGAEQRTGRISNEVKRLQTESIQLDNEIKRTELASKIRTLRQPGSPPGYGATIQHIPGQPPTGELKVQRRLQPTGPAPNVSYGVNPEVDMFKSKTGHIPMVPTDLGESLESMPLAAAEYYIRNNLLPIFADKYKSPPYPAAPGNKWTYRPVFGYNQRSFFQPRSKSRKRYIHPWRSRKWHRFNYTSR